MFRKNFDVYLNTEAGAGAPRFVPTGKNEIKNKKVHPWRPHLKQDSSPSV